MKFFIIEKTRQDTSGVSVMQKIVAQLKAKRLRGFQGFSPDVSCCDYDVKLFMRQLLIV
jgi:hypothetical protein